MFVWLWAALWLALQLGKPKVEACLTRLCSTSSFRISRTSFDLSTSTLDDLPRRILDRVGRRGRNAMTRLERRWPLYWDVGAVAALVGFVLVQVVLVAACWTSISTLYTVTSRPHSSSHVKRTANEPGASPRPSDGLLIQPLIPGVTTDWSSAPFLLSALVVSQIFHETGHAFAAASESVPIVSVGLSLYFLILPTFHVSLGSPSASRARASSFTTSRIAAAGVWHNVHLALVGAVAADEGRGWARAVLKRTAMQEVSEGVMVVRVDPTSSLSDLVPPRSILTHLDDLDLSTSLDSPLELYNRFFDPAAGLSDLNQTAEAVLDNAALGWCLPSRLFVARDRQPDGSCCAIPNERSSARKSSSSHALCFVSDPTLATCVERPETLFQPSRKDDSSSPSATDPVRSRRCRDTSSCRVTSSDGVESTQDHLVCAHVAPEERVLRIGVSHGRSVSQSMDVGHLGSEQGPARGGRAKGRETIVWQGRRRAVVDALTVTDLEPRFWFVPLGLERLVSRWFSYVQSIRMVSLDRGKTPLSLIGRTD
ncbi:hypothetical protein JCM10212_006632 [Sporobolomyces blumeae]